MEYNKAEQKLTFKTYELEGRFIDLHLVNGDVVREFNILRTNGLDQDGEIMADPDLIGVDANGTERTISLAVVEKMGVLDTDEQARLARLQRRNRPDVEKLRTMEVPAGLEEFIADTIEMEESQAAEEAELIARGVKPYQRKEARA